MPLPEKSLNKSSVSNAEQHTFSFKNNNSNATIKLWDSSAKQNWDEVEILMPSLDRITEINLSPIGENDVNKGVTVAWFLAHYQQWGLLKKLVEKAQQTINLNAGPTHVDNPYKDITVAYFLALKQQHKLLKSLAETAQEAINLNAGPTHVDNLDKGVTVAYLLAFDQQWELLKSLAKTARKAINLNAGPTHVNNTDRGITVAWFLAYYKQWDLLGKLAEKMQEPIEITTCPRNDDQLKEREKPLIELLIDNEQYELLDTLLNKYDTNTAKSILHNILQKHNSPGLLEIAKKYYRTDYNEIIEQIKNLLSDIADQFSSLGNISITDSLDDQGYGIRLSFPLNLSSLPDENEIKFSKEGASFEATEVKLKTPEITLNRQKAIAAIQKAFDHFNMPINPILALNGSAYELRLDIHDSSKISSTASVSDAIRQNLVLASKEYSEAEEQQRLTKMHQVKATELQARITKLKQRVLKNEIEPYESKLKNLLADFNEMIESAKMDLPQVPDLGPEHQDALTAHNFSTAQTISASHEKLKKSAAKWRKRFTDSTTSFIKKGYQKQFTDLQQALINTISELDDSRDLNYSIEQATTCCDQIDRQLENLDRLIKLVAKEKVDLYDELEELGKNYKKQLQEYQEVINSFHYKSAPEIINPALKITSSIHATSIKHSESSKASSSRIGKANPPTSSGLRLFSSPKTSRHDKEKTHDKDSSSYEPPPISIADFTNSEKIQEQLRDLGDLKSKYEKDKNEKNSTAEGQRTQCSCSSQNHDEIFKLAYLYKLLMIFELMKSWPIGTSTANDLRNGIMHGYYAVTFPMLEKFVNTLIKEPVLTLPSHTKSNKKTSTTSDRSVYLENLLQKLPEYRANKDTASMETLKNQVNNVLSTLHDTDFFRIIFHSSQDPDKDMLKEFLDKLVETVEMVNEYHSSYSRALEEFNKNNIKGKKGKEKAKQEETEIPKDWSLIHECRDAVSMILVILGEIYQTLKRKGREDDQDTSLLELLHSDVKWRSFFKECDQVRIGVGHLPPESSCEDSSELVSIKFEPISDLEIIALAQEGTAIAKEINSAIDDNYKVENR